MKKLILTIVLAALCLFLSNASRAQVIKITGVIIDQQGQTLSDATIQIVNQNIKTKSNIDGTFTINSPIQSGALKVSYLGYHDKQISFNENSLKRFSVVLEAINDVLKEVEINAGYYTVKDRERTGSISRIDATTIQQQPVSNPLGAMIGRMAGVNIEQQSGVNGGGFSVEIRGRNSLRSEARQPLFLIDGITYPSTPITNSSFSIGSYSFSASPLNYINPADIESIEVLKDADATAIYGSRGANGVVLITTKKAKSGSSTFEIGLFRGLSRVPRLINMLNTAQYLEMRNEAFKNDGSNPTALDYDVNGLWDQNRYTNWQKELIGGTASNTSIQTNLSGGNEFTQFVFRGNFNRQTTVSPGDFSDRKTSGAIGVNHSSNNRKLNINFNVNYLIDLNNLPRYDLAQYIDLAPNAPSLYDQNGNLNWELNSNGTATWSNPLAATKQPYSTNTGNLLSNVKLAYFMTPGLNLTANAGYTSIKLRENLLIPISSLPPSLTATGNNRVNHNTIETWMIEPQLNYKKSFKKHRIDFLIGSTVQRDKQFSESISGNGYTNDLLLQNITSAPSKGASGTNSQYKYFAIYSRLNYNYQDKYILNFTGRRDGSSRFGDDHHFANFGAIGFAWNFSNEKFISDQLPFLSFGRIRGSIGMTGSDQIPNYGYLETYSATQNPYQNGSGLFPTRLANPDYSWESNKKIELALDLHLLNNNIQFSLDWYRNRSSNQLVGYNLPDITGFSTIQYNLPATVQNTGLELEVHTKNIATRKFHWETRFNLTIPSNKLIAYPNLSGSTYANIYTLGESLYTPRTYRYLGVDRDLGKYIYEDRNQSNSLNASDRVAADRSLSSHYYGGLSNSLTYKSFTLDISFQFVSKTTYSPFTFYSTPGLPNPGFQGNQPIEILNRWRQPGDETDIQKYTQSFTKDGLYQAFSNILLSDRFADASFVRLKNASLSWIAPLKWLKVKQLRIYIEGQNLFTITKYPGDPEVANPKVLPSLRTVVSGAQLTF